MHYPHTHCPHPHSPPHTHTHFTPCHTAHTLHTHPPTHTNTYIYSSGYLHYVGLLHLLVSPWTALPHWRTGLPCEGAPWCWLHFRPPPTAYAHSACPLNHLLHGGWAADADNAGSLHFNLCYQQPHAVRSFVLPWTAHACWFGWTFPLHTCPLRPYPRALPTLPGAARPHYHLPARQPSIRASNHGPVETFALFAAAPMPRSTHQCTLPRPHLCLLGRHPTCATSHGYALPLPHLTRIAMQPLCHLLCYLHTSLHAPHHHTLLPHTLTFTYSSTIP